MRRTYYGWYIIAASLVVMTFGIGGGLYLFGVLVPSLLSEFAWTYAQVSGANSVAMIAMGLAGPLVARLTDRHGPRKLMTTSAVCCGVGFAAQSLVGRLTSLNGLVSPLTQLYACYIVYGVGLAGIGYVPVNTIVSGWFVQRRGLALGIVAVGVGLGGFLTMPAGWLIDHFGWRRATATIGVTITALVLPIVALVMRQHSGLDQEPPVRRLRATDVRTVVRESDAVGAPGSVAAFLTSWTFWALAMAFGVYTVTVTIVRVFGIALLQGRGMAAPDARVVMSALAFWGILGKVAFGALTDRMSSRLVATAAFVLAAVGPLFLLGSATSVAVASFAVVYGLPMGGIASLQPVLIAEYFDQSAFGIVYGTLVLLLTLGAAGGPVIAGRVYDMGGGYQPTLVACIAASGVAALLVWTAGHDPVRTERGITPIES